jgi:hypothetical protein
MTASLRVELAIGGLPWSDLAGFLEGLAACGELHADALSVAAAALRSWLPRPDRADLERLEARLAGSADERLRRLALAALVAQAELPGAWNETRLQRLRAYRADRSPLVAAAAQFTLPIDEI